MLTNGTRILWFLHQLADEEVTPFHVLHARVVLGESGLYATSIADLLSTSRSMGCESFKSNSRTCTNRSRWMASVAASDAATISASQEDKATLFCFLEPQEIAAWLKMKTCPEGHHKPDRCKHAALLFTSTARVPTWHDRAPPCSCTSTWVLRPTPTLEMVDTTCTVVLK